MSVSTVDHFLVRDSEHYRVRLERYEHETPELPGPAALHPMYIAQRKRKLKKKYKKAASRERRWKSDKRPVCRGPSFWNIFCANFCTYWLFGICCLSLLVFVLWYTGILGLLVWLYQGFVFLFAKIVSFNR